MIVKSEKPSGNNYRTVSNIIAIEINNVTIPLYTLSQRSNVLVSSHTGGRSDWAKYSIQNIYRDSEGNIYFTTDTKPHAFIISNPPSGYYKVYNIYYDMNYGEVIIE